MLGKQSADQPHHNGIQRGEFCSGGAEPCNKLLFDVFAGFVSQQRQQKNKNGVAGHDGGDGQNLGGNAQQESQYRGTQRHHQTAADAAHQGGNGQNGIDARAGHQLSHGLGERLQRYQQGQHNGSFSNPTDFIVHIGFLIFLW